jgi:hypothetical protein
MRGSTGGVSREAYTGAAVNSHAATSIARVGDDHMVVDQMRMCGRDGRKEEQKNQRQSTLTELLHAGDVGISRKG